MTEENARALLIELQDLFQERAQAVAKGDRQALRSVETSAWYTKADAFEMGNEQEKEHILMPLAQGLGILIAAPFAIAGGLIFAAGAILYGAGKTVLGIGNLLTGGVFQ